jgi:hypothetical protein
MIRGTISDEREGQLSSKTLKLALGPTKPAIQCLPGSKRPERVSETFLLPYGITF